MTQTTPFSTAGSFPLPDTFSSELVQLIDRVKPSIVQVQNQGRGAGTAIIWHLDGTNATILTNHHVVADKATVHIRLSDGRILEAEVIDTNPTLDLATLKVSADNLIVATPGDSSHLRIGELVFAIGHPWGQGWVVTAGIVSGLGTVKVPYSDRIAQYIRSDVPIAPGNSGGPLLDAQGTVIGINSMVLGGDLAVAIPSNVVSSWLEELANSHKINTDLNTLERSA